VALNNVKGLLFDLDGVLYTGNQAINGAVEVIDRIHASGIPCRFITNTSTQSIKTLQQKLFNLGFAIHVNEIISAPQAALLYLSQHKQAVCRLLLADDVKQDFLVFHQSDLKPDFIVIGDIGNAWSYDLLNALFLNVMQGAKLIAIHKNRFWQTEQGLQLDIGGFISALEYATGSQAMIIGKPSPDFFKIALDDLGLQANEVAIIGDDIDADVGGGQQAGLLGVLVKTGKYRESYASKSRLKPDLVINSIMDLPQALLNS
jgi:HAD superfamily hydrolase (TIGR01458 family)